MPLSLQSRRVGEVTVIVCNGRIVAGEESAALMQHLDTLLPANPHVVLHLGGVEFIDSSGLGLLVRCLTRTRNARGSLKVCAVSPKIDEVLRVTKLERIFQPYQSEEAAIAAAHRATRTDDTTISNANVLCVDTSADVVAYVRELLTEAGYRVVTATNLPDAFILLAAIQPKVVVIGAELYDARGIRTAEGFRRQADARRVVKLQPDFSRHDAGAAAQELLGEVRAIMDDGPATSA